MAKTNVTAERVRELFYYDPETGVLTHKTTGRKRVKGVVVGTPVVNKCGHKVLVLSLEGGSYLAHRVVWAHVNGEWPRGKIDHINGDARDNRIVNLRDTTDSENSRNLKLGKANTSGFMGVAWRECKQKWRAHITIMGKQIHLGYFHNKEDAILVRVNALREFGFSPRHGTTV